VKYQGVVVLFKPDANVFNSINSYVDELDRLYVVDNTPNADISDRFQSEKIKYIPLQENKGIAYALNVGAKKAIEDGADWLLTMDQDSTFEKNALDKMKKFIQKSKNQETEFNYDKLGIVSPCHMTMRNKNENPQGIVTPILVMTSGNLVNLNAYQDVLGYKDWMFIDCVDFDFCLNLRKHGYEIVQINDARLNHNLGDIIEKHIFGKTCYVDNHSAFRRYFIVRNRQYIYDMYHDDFPTYCELEKKCTRKELIKVWLFEKNKIKKTLAMYRGYRDYKKGIKGDGNEKKY